MLNNVKHPLFVNMTVTYIYIYLFIIHPCDPTVCDLLFDTAM